jgi:hypothetical protein
LSELSLDDLLSVRTSDDSANTKIEDAEKALKQYLKDIQESFDEKKQKITRGHDLAPGVIKIVKVYLAVKEEFSQEIRWLVDMVTKVSYQRLCQLRICHMTMMETLLILS